MASYEVVPFLDDHKDKPKENKSHWHIDSKHPNIWLRKLCITTSLLLNVLLALAVIVLVLSVNKNDLLDPHSFARDAIVYKDTVFPLVNESIYAGPPSTRGDAAWEKLLYPQVIRVAKGEFTRQWDNPVKLQEGPGFSSSMSVYHEMHCVRYLRRFVYSEHYFPNATTDDYLFSQVHADHCLNLILQSIMCSADTTLINMYWLSGRTVPKYNPVKTPRSCVDWEKLENSLKSRVISHAEIGRLKNPL